MNVSIDRPGQIQLDGEQGIDIVYQQRFIVIF